MRTNNEEVSVCVLMRWRRKAHRQNAINNVVVTAMKEPGRVHGGVRKESWVS